MTAPRKAKLDNKEDNTPSIDFKLGVLLERSRSVWARARELELGQYGVTPEQAAVLHILLEKGGSATIDELANTLIRQYHTVASIVSRMLKNGLVRKEKPHQQNKFVIFISEEGESIFRKIPASSNRKLFSCLSAEEKEQLESNLTKVICNGRYILDFDRIPPVLSEDVQY